MEQAGEPAIASATTGAAMDRSVSQKMGVKEGTRAHFVNAPEIALKAMGLPSLDVSANLTGNFDFIHFFVMTQSEMDSRFPKLKAHLQPTGMLWVSWPKGRKLNTDLTLPQIIRIGYNHGLVESTALSINETWSALKFTHPKAGKVYKNSYGQLPSG
jgi:hypothetical protein